MANNAAQNPVLDFDIIDGLRSILGDDIYELFADFLEQAPQEIAQLHTVFGKNNFEELSRVAHSLKGSSGNLGIAALSDLCANLEHDARDGIESSLQTYIHSIEADFEVAKESINKLLAQK